jgi:nucleoside-diphosphate-sugar epimerase
MPPADTGLTIAVTGPTGTFGFGLLPLLEDDDRVDRVVGIARRPFDPAEHGWTKLAYRRGDVRDPEALRDAFAGADVVVHLAFLVTGTASGETTRAINVEGTLNAFRAAAAAGARRFVYASSVAAYGFHPDNPVGMREDWPVRPAARLFYAREKAELEQALTEQARLRPDLELYLLRPPVVLGPHTVGAKDVLPGPLAPLGRRLAELAVRGALPRPPLPVPDRTSPEPAAQPIKVDLSQSSRVSERLNSPASPTRPAPVPINRGETMPRHARATAPAGRAWRGSRPPRQKARPRQR